MWQEIIRLLEEPDLLQAEIERRVEAAQKADPVRKRQESLLRELARRQAAAERLLMAYQDDLLTLEQLRNRIPECKFPLATDRLFG